MNGNIHVRFGPGEKVEITSKSYLLVLFMGILIFIFMRVDLTLKHFVKLRDDHGELDNLKRVRFSILITLILFKKIV